MALISMTREQTILSIPWTRFVASRARSTILVPAEALGVEVEGVGGRTGRRGRLERQTAAGLGTMAGLGTAAGREGSRAKEGKGGGGWEGGAANEKQREKHERGSRPP